MANKRLPIEKILTLLMTSPQTAAELTAVLTPTQLRTAPGEGEWSATQVLAHLRSCAALTGAGRPLERTVQFYAQWLAEHERSHLKQFKQIVKAMRE
ncbi:MAG: hypothetical protein KDE48_02675 [Anaerolineales bacterium]|nr:hypothetical protein [Anaerolineales bacterium]